MFSLRQNKLKKHIINRKVYPEEQVWIGFNTGSLLSHAPKHFHTFWLHTGTGRKYKTSKRHHQGALLQKQ